jgi:Ca2+-binding RTX toxin-like protein
MAHIYGTNGSDIKYGTNDADNFHLFEGDDYAYGYDGNDVAWGDAGNDRFEGGNGDDGFVGGPGADTFYGGNGNDTTFYQTNSTGVSIYLNNNNAWDGSAWDYQYDVEHAHGSNWNDTIYGNAGDNGLIGAGGADYLAGLDGNDTLFGGDQSDTLEGGSGNDWLSSGIGYDTLRGGSGADTFFYNDNPNGDEAYWDTIRDFSRAEGDKVHLGGIDAKFSAAGDQPFSWVGQTTVALGEGQLGYYQSGGNTYIYGNSDADGQYEVFIELSGNVDLIGSDFYL